MRRSMRVPRAFWNAHGRGPRPIRYAFGEDRGRPPSGTAVGRRPSHGHPPQDRYEAPCPTQLLWHGPRLEIGRHDLQAERMVCHRGIGRRPDQGIRHGRAVQPPAPDVRCALSPSARRTEPAAPARRRRTSPGPSRATIEYSRCKAASAATVQSARPPAEAKRGVAGGGAIRGSGTGGSPATKSKRRRQ
jgi:hypothetical protein